MTAEIIDFKTRKKSKSSKEPKPLSKTKKQTDKELRTYANDMVDDYMIRLIHEWKAEGLTIGSNQWEDSKHTFKELGFFIEVLRALIHKEFDLKHPMHDVMENMMKIIYDKKNNKYFSQISYPKIERTVEFEGEDLE